MVNECPEVTVRIRHCKVNHKLTEIAACDVPFQNPEITFLDSLYIKHADTALAAKYQHMYRPFFGSMYSHIVCLLYCLAMLFQLQLSGTGLRDCQEWVVSTTTCK